MQATPRDARIDVEDVYHVRATIGPSTAPCIATKDRTYVIGEDTGCPFTDCKTRIRIVFPGQNESIALPELSRIVT